jgi:2-keto-4-pentenoate hydratase/2-oxohepta-3-ene-1,7-dioic acid hydratase in catechol pathway
MRLVRFMSGDAPRFGWLDGDSVRPVAAADFSGALTGTVTEERMALSDVKLLAPVARPGKILGIAVNYAAHAAESVSFVKADPGTQKWFNKQVSAVNGPYDPVHLPKVSAQLDYEGELVAVIGKSGRHVPRERALDIVAGYCVGCDYSVRDWQRASPTMIMGKGFDTHAVFGPAVVSPDEAGDIRAAGLRTYVNGSLRQNAKIGDMTHDLQAQIAFLTTAFTLEPGDVIFTGTPAGVGAGRDPPVWLNAGDTVRVEIDGLGFIENRIVDEPAALAVGLGK